MGEDLKYNGAQRREYLTMIDRIGANWIAVFEGDKEFYSSAYWDLLTQLWRRDGPVRKTEALGYMQAIKSAHTAGKYVQDALDHNLIEEADNPEDARSKLVALTPRMRERLDRFFDTAVGELRIANRQIDIKGPSPEDP
ncbi:MAG: hypothetical protein AAF530_22685 [Pseudomonadota bacterium]